MEGITPLIIEYRYWILLPLSFIEGPIIAFIAGTLASLGYFNVFALGVFFLVRDVVVDLIMYAIGHYGGKTAFVHRLLNRWGVTEEEMEDVRQLWHKKAWQTMFFSKLSYGVAAAFIIVAGMVGMPLKKFIGYAIAIAFLHYGVLLIVGFYLGSSFGSVTKIVANLQYVIGAATILITGYILFKFYIRRKLRRAEKEIHSNQ